MQEAYFVKDQRDVFKNGNQNLPKQDQDVNQRKNEAIILQLTNGKQMLTNSREVNTI